MIQKTPNETFLRITRYQIRSWHFLCAITELKVHRMVLALGALVDVFCRCYFVYRLVVGLASADDVAQSLKSPHILCSILSMIYDIPRIYLNVNLFGSLCSFYHNIIAPTAVVTTLRHYDGKFHVSVDSREQNSLIWGHLWATFWHIILYNTSVSHFVLHRNIFTTVGPRYNVIGYNGHSI